MLPKITKESLSPAEACQLPVELASVITAEVVGARGAPGGKTAPTAEPPRNYSTSAAVCTAVRDFANCLRVSLSTLTSDWLNIYIRLYFISSCQMATRPASWHVGPEQHLHQTTNPSMQHTSPVLPLSALTDTPVEVQLCRKLLNKYRVAHLL